MLCATPAPLPPLIFSTGLILQPYGGTNSSEAPLRRRLPDGAKAGEREGRHTLRRRWRRFASPRGWRRGGGAAVTEGSSGDARAGGVGRFVRLGRGLRPGGAVRAHLQARITAIDRAAAVGVIACITAVFTFVLTINTVLIRTTLALFIPGTGINFGRSSVFAFLMVQFY